MEHKVDKVCHYKVISCPEIKESIFDDSFSINFIYGITSLSSLNQE